MSLWGTQDRGMLEITVVGCHQLRDTLSGRQNPYLTLNYGTTSFKTKTCENGGKNHTFQEKFQFKRIEGLEEIVVTVCNSLSFMDSSIGMGKVNLEKVLRTGYDDTACPLESLTGKRAGEVILTMHLPKLYQCKHLLRAFVELKGPHCYSLYKQVCSDQGGHNSHVEVYSSSSNSWRTLHSRVPKALGTGKFLNRALHWVSVVDGCPYILSFDLESETCSGIDFPTGVVPRVRHLRISVQEDAWLSFLKSYHGMNHIDIWLMREYGDVGSWTR